MSESFAMRAMSALLSILGWQACLPSAFDEFTKKEDEASSSSDMAGHLPDSARLPDAGAELPATDRVEAEADAGSSGPSQPNGASLDGSGTAAISDAAADAEARAPDAGQDAGGDAGAGSEAASCGDVLNDPERCGDRDLRCVAPEEGYASCRAGSCFGITLARVGLSAADTHGNTGDVRTFNNQMCSGNQVLTGLELHYVQDSPDHLGVVFGFAVRCGKVKLSARASGVVAEIEPGDRPTVVGYGNGEGMGPISVDHRDCGPGELVTNVDISTWNTFGYTTIKDIALTCSALQFDAQGKLQLVLAERLSVPVGTGGNEVALFHDECDVNSAVVGFRGTSAAHIDRISTQCSELVVRSTPTQAMPSND